MSTTAKSGEQGTIGDPVSAAPPVPQAKLEEVVVDG